MIPDALYVVRNVGAIKIRSSNSDGMIVFIDISCTAVSASADFAATAVWEKIIDLGIINRSCQGFQNLFY